MTLPDFPTDNLYKFMAIAGLTVFVVGLVVPFLIEDREIETFYRQQEKVNERLKAFILSTTELFIKEGLHEKDLQHRLDVFAETNKALAGIAQQESKLFYGEMKKRSDNAKSSKRWLSVASISGLVFAIFGFALWYIKAQRYVDQQLVHSIKSQGHESWKKPIKK